MCDLTSRTDCYLGVHFLKLFTLSKVQARESVNAVRVLTSRKKPQPRRREHDRQLHAEGMVTKAALSAALVSLRERSGLTQAQLCRRAGWEAQFVSRLESGRGRMPDITTLIRYGKVCGVSVGLLFARGNSVISSLTLQQSDHRRPFDALAGHSLNGAELALDPHL
jgi:transcriptional regulator with XRE-family HTH domain